jgi:hypothetical protein
MELVLFISSEGGHAALAAGFFNALVKPWVACAISATPDPAALDRNVVAAFQEVHGDRSLLPPSRLSTELAGWAAEVVQVGRMPSWFQMEGIRAREWDVGGPERERTLGLRTVRDAIRGQVTALLREKTWLRGGEAQAPR